MNYKKALIVSAISTMLVVPSVASAGAILSGFDGSTLSRNDDSSTTLVGIGFTTNFFGTSYADLYVNNNGNVTYGTSLSTFTPFDLTATGKEIIAPFFADVDTRSAGNAVTYGAGTYDGMTAFGVNWINVDYYSSSTSHTNRNSFQLILVDRSDVGAGDFDIIFNYDQIQWESGTASNGNSSGLGGDSARAGYSNGTSDAGTFFELDGSALNGALLDGGVNALVSHSMNSNVLGRYIFSARNGDVIVTPTGGVPEPGMLALLSMGLLMLGLGRRRKA